ncbi:MAG TPA: response regulator transcription factor [Solirubrobacteraceae bacterium]|nr:response regulator transcription factor [Solirubrobacteraceae bacterium]
MNERIVIIDDDVVVRDVARMALERDGYIVHSAGEGAGGLALTAARTPALIVLDLGLPDVSGEVVLQEVRRRSDVPILVLSARGRMEERVRGLGLGADDYLPKPFSPLELVARVKALLRRSGGQPAARDLLAFDAGRLEIDSVRHEVRIDGAPRGVTRSEFDLLHVLAQYPGRAYTRVEIAYRLRGHDFDGDERLVDVHVRNLRRKIELDPAHPRCVETVRGVGYRLGVEPA